MLIRLRYANVERERLVSKPDCIIFSSEMLTDVSL